MPRLHRLALLFTCTALLAASLPAEETYLLRGHPFAEPGVLVKYEGTSKMRDGKIYDDSGKELGFAYMNNILNMQWENLSDTRVRVLITKSLFSHSSNISPEPILVENPLEGCPIEGNLVGDLWKFTLVEGEPTEEQQERLDAVERAAYSDYLMYPVKPMAIGDTYDIPGDVLSVGLDPEAIILDEPTGTLTLLDVVDYEGTRCAKIELVTDMHLQYIDEQGSRIFKVTETSIIYRTLDTFIELYEEEDSQMEIRFQYDWGYVRQVGTTQGGAQSQLIEAA